MLKDVTRAQNKGVTIVHGKKQASSVRRKENPSSRILYKSSKVRVQNEAGKARIVAVRSLGCTHMLVFGLLSALDVAFHKSSREEGQRKTHLMTELLSGVEARHQANDHVLMGRPTANANAAAGAVPPPPPSASTAMSAIATLVAAAALASFSKKVPLRKVDLKSAASWTTFACHFLRKSMSLPASFAMWRAWSSSAFCPDEVVPGRVVYDYGVAACVYVDQGEGHHVTDFEILVSAKRSEGNWVTVSDHVPPNAVIGGRWPAQPVNCSYWIAQIPVDSSNLVLAGKIIQRTEWNPHARACYSYKVDEEICTTAPNFRTPARWSCCRLLYSAARCGSWHSRIANSTTGAVVLASTP